MKLYSHCRPLPTSNLVPIIKPQQKSYRGLVDYVSYVQSHIRLIWLAIAVISRLLSQNAAAQLRRGKWLAEGKLRLPDERQVSCRSFALGLGSAVDATVTRVVTLVHASPRILRHPISKARGIANVQQTGVETAMAGFAQALVPG